MIYPVKILNKKGKVKKVISASKLADLHWQNFYADENQIDLMHGPKNNMMPRNLKKKLDLKFAGLYDPSFSFIN